MTTNEKENNISQSHPKPSVYVKPPRNLQPADLRTVIKGDVRIPNMK